MPDPYTTPKSNVDSAPGLSGRGGWKIVFWLIVALQAMSIFILFAQLQLGESVYATLFDIFIYMFVLLGLFGYAYHRVYFNRLFWRLLLPVVIGWDAWFAFDSFQEIEPAELLVAALVAASVYIIMLFGYLGLYRYAGSLPVKSLVTGAR